MGHALGGWCRTGLVGWVNEMARALGTLQAPEPAQRFGRCAGVAVQVSWEARAGLGWIAGCRSGSSCAGCCPASVVTAEAQDSEPGEVGSGGEQGEVGGDLELPADPGSAPAVAAAHQVADLALDLGPGRPVISPPARPPPPQPAPPPPPLPP